ncbi:oxidoreductase [Anaerobacillus alkalilacustris]|uniref:Oxidoreductase n=1 Tax=Anaerobacillus alkalilacustris TaxID=393763 RepID=A0A1S2LFW9_9BACI|nr:Gfo/Idh/MocA family oxidoreductase [Anaerobacillus alkalilacustris]OIJ10395.1 oxidoreductase [Anaerobacillus alkalilacustris]
MSNSIKFAILGCGRIAKKHIEALSKLENTKIVAVCDILENRAKIVSNQLQVPYYTNYDKMLLNEDINVVSILTPSGLHAEHTIDIVKKYKKHIVCEKPMSLNLEDAERCIKVCQENNVKLFIVMQNRYNTAIRKLKDTITDNRFGKIVLGTVRIRWKRDQNYYDQDEWRGTWDLDGGCITNQASHHIDLLQWLLGEPIEVIAKTATRLLNIEVEDTGVAILKFASGALGVIEVTTATRPKDLEGSISILGEKGSVEIGGFSVNEMKTWLFEEKHPDDESAISIKENPENVYGFGHISYLRDVVDAIKNNKSAPVDGVEGKKSLEIIHAIYESAITGKTVYLKYQPKKSPLGKNSTKDN